MTTPDPTPPTVTEAAVAAELDPDEVRQWLADAASRRDIPGPLDDPTHIAEQIQRLRGQA